MNFVYHRFLRSYLPRRLTLVNGEYAVYATPLFDAWSNDRIDAHEIELLDAVSQTVVSGDDVVIIGGGFGVATLEIARTVTEAGSVMLYEASGDLVETLRQTFAVNQVDDHVSVIHGAVGEIVSVWGGDNSQLVETGEVPDCDVLVMDCDGAERTILEHLHIRPRHLIVEYHADLGTPEDDIRDLLANLGYACTLHEVEVPDRGIGVLAARFTG